MPMSLSHCGTRRLSSTTVRSALLLLLFLALSARQTSAADSSQEPKPPNRQQEYLRKNVELQGVVELESGLQYQILKSGDAAGPSPGPNTPCAVHYRGTTIDRIEFGPATQQRPHSTVATVFGLYKLGTHTVCRHRWNTWLNVWLPRTIRAVGGHPRLDRGNAAHARGRPLEACHSPASCLRGAVTSTRCFMCLCLSLCMCLCLCPCPYLFLPRDSAATLASVRRGAGSHIGPGATLIFDMELVKVFEGEARQYPGSFILE